MRFGVAFVQAQGVAGRGLCHRVSFQRFNVGIGQIKPYLRDSGPGAREVWIFVERALEKSQAFAQVFLAAFIREVETLQVEIVCLRVSTRRCRRSERELNS